MFFIGTLRRFLFVPWNSRWNAWVRDWTARLEGTWLVRSKLDSQPPGGRMECRDMDKERHGMIAGAVFDFCGRLTSRATISVGSSENAKPIMDALSEWAEERGLCLEDADVKGWPDRLLSPATAQVPLPDGRTECSDDRGTTAF